MGVPARTAARAAHNQRRPTVASPTGDGRPGNQPQLRVAPALHGQRALRPRARNVAVIPASIFMDFAATPETAARKIRKAQCAGCPLGHVGRPRRLVRLPGPVNV